MPFTVGQYLTANDLKSQEDAHTLGYGVVSGLKVVPTDPASMDVQVETGKAYAADALVEKGAVTDLTVSAADPTNPRKDIAVCNSAGTLSIVAGTPEAALPSDKVGVYTLKPEPPSIPANSIILAEIWVPAGATSITGSEIYDKRVFTVDRLNMARMPDMALDKVMVGQGPGANPQEVDKPVSVPSGLIGLWHGTIANIPASFVICDGNNSTPNLLTRFLEGVATAATNPGATGGATAKATAGHVHAGPSHTHTGPSHQHDAPVCASAANILQFGNPFGTGGVITWPLAYAVGAAGGEHPAAKVKAGGTENTGAGGTANTGSKTDSIADIRPKYYDIAFIMKT